MRFLVACLKDTSTMQLVAYAPTRAASTLMSMPVELSTNKRRDESRRGTHECVRHVRGWHSGLRFLESLGAADQGCALRLSRVQPDVSISHREQASGEYFEGSPALAVGVISASNTAEQVEYKRQTYLGGGARCWCFIR